MKTDLTFDEKYQAMCRRDSSYVGIFLTAVKTTGIFCHPTCTARKPKPENVEFFDTLREAILNGYRPCKLCKPMELPQRMREDVQLLLRELQGEPALRIKDCDIRRRVWEELLTIPYGETRNYADQARRIGQPNAVRAVASANGHNRIAIVTPCHRVIGTDGSLTGYGGELARKKWLLDFEKKVLAANRSASTNCRLNA